MHVSVLVSVPFVRREMRLTLSHSTNFFISSSETFVGTPGITYFIRVKHIILHFDGLFTFGFGVWPRGLDVRASYIGHIEQPFLFFRADARDTNDMFIAFNMF